MKLPADFKQKMEQLLGEEFPLFLESYERDKHSGLRANRLKISPDQLVQLLPYLGLNVPWSSDGFYYDETHVRPAKHPYYYAGLYYLQEPSAMLPAELLSVKPFERVLDLCAAPGGKSIQLAAQLEGTGLLVSNDIHPQRSRVLLKNLERYGVTNAIVLNESPERLAEVFAGYFDKILVDAPCSGEGMFRKEPDMMKNWSPDEVAKYATWQKEILEQVPKMLRPGGTVVYSTCTFSKEENEDQIEQFIHTHPAFVVDSMQRLWPHQVDGEGHFAAKLRSEEYPDTPQDPHVLYVPYANTLEQKSRSVHKDVNVGLTQSVLQTIAEFSEQVWGQANRWKQWMPNLKNGQIVERQGHILFESQELPSLRGLRVLRSGWLIGTVERQRFRPSPAYALGLPKDAVAQAVQVCDFRTDDEQGLADAIRYLRGETIQIDGRKWDKGWHLVCIDGYPLGWAKGAGASLKNEFPPGWRWEDGGRSNG
jgi:NOL1/NOP2/sun family putative RNA methylase